MRRRWETWAPPAIIFIIINILYAVSAPHWFSVAARVRWDAQQYLDIAERGYDLVPCARLDYPTDGWCGNAGWFPLYPYLLRAVSLTGIPPGLAAVLVAEAAALGVLVLLWHLLGAKLSVANLAALALGALLPAGVYLHSGFPLSLTVLLALVAVLFLTRGRWVLAGLAGALAATAYPTGVLVAAIPTVHLLLAAGPVRQRIARAALVAALGAAGTLAVFALLAATTGRFDAYLLVQAKYGNGLHNPLTTFSALAAGDTLTANTTGPTELLGRVTDTAATELWFSTALVLVTLAAVTYLAVRRRATGLDWALAGYGLLVLAVPLLLGVNVAQYRSHTLLVPVVLALSRAPAWVTTGLLGAAVLLTPGMTELIVAGYLV